jgi:type I restriction enzyme S subunit
MGNKSREDFDESKFEYKIIMFKEIFYNSKLPDRNNLKTTVKLKKGELERFNVKKGDVFLTSSSETMNELAMSSVAYKDYHNTVYSGFSKRLRPKTNLTVFEFMRYWFRSKNFRNEIDKTVAMTTRANLNLSILSNIEVSLPSIKKQKVIANILSSLDDKIALNNKINYNLEKLAQTLYNHWFVDFEFPNEKGEPYKSSGGEMVDSELGFIPKGWEVISLGELVIKKSEKFSPNKELKLIDMANMPSYSISLNNFDLGDKLKTNTFKMEKYTFLYGSIRPYLGKFGISPFDGITTGTIHNFISKNRNDYSLIASIVFSKNFNEFCIKLSHGTKMPTVKWDDFVSFKIPYNYNVSHMFNKIIRVYFDEIVSNVLESIKLAELRDLLLPKLMSGEIEVPVEE